MRSHNRQAVLDRQALLAPLRLRTLLWQLALLVGVEALLLRSYAAHVAEFHWATNLLVGLAAAALWDVGVLLVTDLPARWQLLPVLVFHLWAMWPDLAFRAGLPHERWMDWLALGHISSHGVPGRDTTWLVVALAVTAWYVLYLRRWLLRQQDAALRKSA
jgi:hypothetical protein